MKTYAIAFCILKHHVKLLPLIMMLLPLQHGEEKKKFALFSSFEFQTPISSLRAPDPLSSSRTPDFLPTYLEIESVITMSLFSSSNMLYCSFIEAAALTSCSEAVPAKADYIGGI